MDDPALMTRHKLDVDEYYRMAEVGILHPEDRVELIDGEIIELAPIGQDHEAAVNGLNQTLVLACLGRGIVSVQNSIRIERLSAPHPDFAVLRFRADFYRTGTRPGPEDVLLVIEVADTSLSYDKTVKRPLYARAGIPEYWIVNLRARLLDAYRHPTGGDYAEPEEHGPGDELALVADPQIVVPLRLAFG